MQSNLRFPGIVFPVGPATSKTLARSLAVYAFVFAIAIALLLSSENASVRAFGLGLIAPGGGFLYFANPEGGAFWAALACLAAATTAFALAILVWFATGMALAAPIAWLLAASFAAIGASGFGAGDIWPIAMAVAPLGVIALLLSMAVAAMIATAAGSARRKRFNVMSANQRPVAATAPAASDEMTIDDLRRLRLLLDRALQPAETFDGFEWRDQFQTAAVRYQINFVSYALSIAQRSYTPAFKGYCLDAQANLLTKLQDPRIWDYWRLENLWGNFSVNADPFARDNIMFSGFMAAQIAYAEAAAGGRAGLAERQIVFRLGANKISTYSFDQLIETLTWRYARAPFGLLACEPNWVFPICNAIAVSGLRADDARSGADRWSEIAPRFRRCLEAEFIAPSGRLVPFRSSAIGIACPPIGGAMMQAFPCFFLNSVLPDIAERQWAALRDDLRKTGLRRAFWPIDVGNYGFSRASSYAASAAAAIEMGDGDLAAHLLGGLDEECPHETIAGVTHRKNASLWAHAVEMFARCGRSGGFRDLVTRSITAEAEPYIEYAPYPDVLVAKAVAAEGALNATLYPGREGGSRRLLIGGLLPSRKYCLRGADQPGVVADEKGRARLDVALDGRSLLSIVPAV